MVTSRMYSPMVGGSESRSMIYLNRVCNKKDAGLQPILINADTGGYDGFKNKPQGDDSLDELSLIHISEPTRPY